MASFVELRTQLLELAQRYNGSIVIASGSDRESGHLGWALKLTLRIEGVPVEFGGAAATKQEAMESVLTAVEDWVDGPT